MTNKLLERIHFGTELEKLESGCDTTFDILEQTLGTTESTTDWSRSRIAEMVRNFASARNKGRFGGQVTAGDTAFIGACMALIRPRGIIEIGVCSGQSSAFILVAANRLDLSSKDAIYLHSFDLARYFEKPDQIIGQVVSKGYKSRLPNWELNLEQTSVDLLDPAHPTRAWLAGIDGPIMAMIDGEHRHPWPLIDALILSLILPKGSWILVQDTQLTERWLANTVERGVPCPEPQRGCSFVLTYWPGTKIAGIEMCYNMAALRTDCDPESMKKFIRVCRQYPFEMPSGEFDKLSKILDRLTCTL